MRETEALGLPINDRRALYEELGLRVLPKYKNGVFVYWALGPHHGVRETTIPGRRYIKKALWRVAAKRGEEERAAWRVANPQHFEETAAFIAAERARIATRRAAEAAEVASGDEKRARWAAIDAAVRRDFVELKFVEVT
jgi:hypothetical protein